MDQSFMEADTVDDFLKVTLSHQFGQNTKQKDIQFFEKKNTLKKKDKIIWNDAVEEFLKVTLSLSI